MAYRFPTLLAPITLNMRRWITILLLCWQCAGCQHRGQYAVKNAGSIDLTEVIVSAGSGHEFMPGSLISKSISGYIGSMPMKSMNKFTISWLDDKEKPHQVVVDVSRKELQDARGVMFVIDDTGTIKKEWFHKRRAE